MEMDSWKLIGRCGTNRSFLGFGCPIRQKPGKDSQEEKAVVVQSRRKGDEN
jgi:hypothetical protein